MPGSLRRSGAFFAPFSLAALQLAPFAIRAAELRAPLNSTSQMIHSIRLFYDDDSSTPVRDPTRNWVLYHCRYYTQSVGAPTGTSTLCCEQEVDLLGQLSQQAARLEEHHVCIILGTLVHHVFVSVLVIVKVSNDVKRQEKYHSVFTILCSVFCVLCSVLLFSINNQDLQQFACMHSRAANGSLLDHQGTTFKNSLNATQCAVCFHHSHRGQEGRALRRSTTRSVP